MSKEAPTPTPTVHPDFHDPRADVVLISSQKTTAFHVRRLQLQASSGTFDDLFETAHPDSPQQEKEDGKVVMTLEDGAEDLERFLRFVVKDVVRPKALELEQVGSLLRMGDKYDAPFVNETAVRFLEPFIAINPPFVFGAAVVYHQPNLARAALAKFGRVLPPTTSISNGEAYCQTCYNKGTYVFATTLVAGEASPGHLLSSIPTQFLERFPFPLFIRLSKMQEDVFCSSQNWEALAATLTDL